MYFINFLLIAPLIVPALATPAKDKLVTITTSMVETVVLTGPKSESAAWKSAVSDFLASSTTITNVFGSWTFVETIHTGVADVAARNPIPPIPSQPKIRKIAAPKHESDPIQTIFPSLLVPVNESEPDVSMGAQHNGTVYTISNDTALEMSFSLPDIEELVIFPNASVVHCKLQLLDPLSFNSDNDEDVEPSQSVFQVFTYEYGAGSIAPTDTWNTRPRAHLDVEGEIGAITVNSSGMYEEGMWFDCNYQGGLAEFIIEASGLTGDISWNETESPQRGFVVLMFPAEEVDDQDDI